MAEKHTYGQILKSSAMIGGSSLVNIGIGVFRTKAMAMLLGPSGVGLMGLYGSILDLTTSVAGMGINSSGVRQIAESSGSAETDKIARTAAVLRRISVFLGLFGALMLAALSGFVADLTFGSERYASGVALLSIAVFFTLVSGGQGALLQGLRRIADMAKVGILGTLFGALISITVVYFFREQGLVLALILIAAMSLATSWWYSRKIQLPRPAVPLSEVRREAGAMLKLGFAFMISGLLMAGAAYAVRLIVIRRVGFDAAGLYQSAWSLGGLYIGFILQAMGTDFYPRLTAIVNDHKACNRMVNEQAHVSLLLAGPGVAATLSLAPLVIAVFYTGKFVGAVEILRWLCLGMTLRVISWPMGFIIVAKNSQNLLILTELAWTLVYLGLAWFCIGEYGLKGAGIAFFGSYVFHVAMIYAIVRRLSGFGFSLENLKTCLLYCLLIGLVFYSHYVLPPMQALAVGVLAVMMSGIYSLRVLVALVSPGRVPQRLEKWLKRFPPASNRANGGGFGFAVTRRTAAAGSRWLWIFMVGAGFSFWVRWYARNYGWPIEYAPIEADIGRLMAMWNAVAGRLAGL